MRPIVLLHGFTQTPGSFVPLSRALDGHGLPSETIDLPGHGVGTGPDRLVTGDLWDGADHVASRIATRAPVVMLGYSMGARLALHVALKHPEIVAGLVIISGTAGIDDPYERTARRAHDHELADRIEEIGVQAFLDDWLALDLFAGLPPDPGRRTRRSSNTAKGLASSLRHWGTGTMDPPLWDCLERVDMLSLVLAGQRDTKFMALGQRLANGIGANADFAVVANASHAAHIEQPAATAALIADWWPTPA